MNMKKNRKGERWTCADEVAEMTGIEVEDAVAMLHGMRLGSNRFLEIASVHVARCIGGHSCKFCKNEHLCASRPMLRMMLANVYETDMHELERRDDFKR